MTPNWSYRDPDGGGFPNVVAPGGRVLSALARSPSRSPSPSLQPAIASVEDVAAAAF